jgi:predicted nucleic acid-binding protein
MGAGHSLLANKVREMMNIFIDTNILLDFYRLSKSDLEELRKIAKLSETKKIKLLVSDYLKDEVYRNREAVIARTVAEFIGTRIELTLPPIFKAYPEYEAISKLIRELKKIKEALLDAIKKDIRKSALVADSVIADLFKSTDIIPVSEDVLRAGIDRTHHAKPPGKRGSCGDSVHWEWLLRSVPKKADLFIISNDKDYESPLQPDKISAYLSEEWRIKKTSKCTLYSSLASFLKDHFPNIKISEEAKSVPATEKKSQPAFPSLAHEIANAAIDYLSVNRVGDMFRELAKNPLQEALLSIESTPLQQILKDSYVSPLQLALESAEKNSIQQYLESLKANQLQEILKAAAPIMLKKDPETSGENKK